jgi:helicase
VAGFEPATPSSRTRCSSIRSADTAPLQRFAPDNIGYLARCKRACVVSDWIEGIPTDEIERTYTTQIYAAPFNYGDIRNVADTTRFHLRSARVSLLLLSVPAFEQEIDSLLMQLEVGLPKDTLDLLALPVALHRGDYLALRSVGVRSREQLWQMQQSQLEGLLGRSVSNQINALRPPAPPAALADTAA